MRLALPSLENLYSLKVRITLAGVVALCFGIALSVSILLHQAERGLISYSQSDALTETARAAAELQRRLTERQVALRTLASDFSPETLLDQDRLAQVLQLHPLFRKSVSSTFVANAAGVIVMVADSDGTRSTTLNIADRPYFRHAVDKQAPGISEPISSRLNGEWSVYLTHPLTLGGEAYGAYIAGLRLKDQILFAGIANAVEAGDKVMDVVTTSTGQILAHPDPTKLGKAISEEPRLADAFESWQAAGSPMDPSGIPVNDASSVVGVASVPGPEWLVWRSRDLRGVVAPLEAGRRAAVPWAGGVVALTALLLSLYLWRSFHPMSKLERRAAHLFDGTVAVNDGWDNPRGEIGRLQRVIRHVASERAQLEVFNSLVLGQLRSVLVSAPVGIALTRGDRLELVSEEFCRLFGRPEQDLRGRGVSVLALPRADLRKLRLDVDTAFRKKVPYKGEWRIDRPNAEPFWGKLYATPVDREDIRKGVIWTVADISTEVRSRQALEWSAQHDPLTGLGNRAAFEQRGRKVLEHGPNAEPAALMILDLDQFKAVNDTYGHPAGDAVLRQVADLLRSSVRPGDLVARLGGDEFAILLERCPTNPARRVAEDVVAKLAATRVPWGDDQLSVGVTIGVAMLGSTFKSLEEWVAEADRACYSAKAAGRNRVHFLF